MTVNLKTATSWSAWWNSVIAPEIENWCPVVERPFDLGTGTHCPYCHKPAGKEHRKWWSPDEPNPEPPGWVA